MKVIYGKSALKFKPVPPPELLDEQADGADQLFSDKRGLLIADPGYGKTLLTTAALCLVHEAELEPTQVCVFVPPIAAFQWAIALASHLLHKGLGNGKQIQVVRDGKDDIDPETTHLVVTYGMIAQRNAKLPDKIRAWRPEVIICDEYEVMASITSKTTEVILGTEKVEGLIDLAKWKWMLTGTPIPRYNDGLYPVLNALYPDVLQDNGVLAYNAFVKEFCYTKLVRYAGMRQAKTVVDGSRNHDRLNKLLYNGCKAMRFKLNLDIEYVERTVLTDFKPSKELRELTLRVMATDGAMATDDNGNPVDEPSTDMALAQRLIGVEKAEAVAQYVMQQIDAKERRGDTTGILVMYWHTDAGAAIAEILNGKGYPAEVLSGADNAQKKHEKAEAMNNGEIDVLVGQIQAMGKAINVQKNSHHVVFAERDWSNARQLQALQRAFRRGQKHNVLVDYCESTNPLEQPKVRVVARKKDSAAKVLDQ